MERAQGWQPRDLGSIPGSGAHLPCDPGQVICHFPLETSASSLVKKKKKSKEASCSCDPLVLNYKFINSRRIKGSYQQRSPLWVP